jgi:hypothetical protein
LAPQPASAISNERIATFTMRVNVCSLKNKRKYRMA